MFKNLWLYSSGEFDVNQSVDNELVRAIDRSRPTLAFIPTESEGADEYFDEFIDRFGRHTYCRFKFMDLENGYDPAKARDLLEADMIYLSGGNTFRLLHNLRRRGMLPLLTEYVANGGFLAGHSAGAIVMSPSIRTASFPQWDRDENDVGLDDMAAMGLFKFELFPHFVPKANYVKELKISTIDSGVPLYALEDGAGIHVGPQRLVFYGGVWCFYNGEFFKVNG